MPEPLQVWIGKEEFGGVPTPTRRGSPEPRHWRLEAIAATERPRDVSVGPDGSTLVFIEDRDTSDVWVLELGERVPHRLTTGRDPMPYWEDTAPALSSDGSTVAFADQGSIWLVPLQGGPPRRLLEAGAPVWLDDRRLVVSVERDDTSRLAVVDVDDPWPQRLARTHEDLDPQGEEWQAAVSPDRSSVAYTFSPRADLNRSEIRVVDVASGRVRALTGTTSTHENTPRWSPDGTALAYASELPGWYELHVVPAEGGTGRQLTLEAADFTHHRWNPDGGRLVAIRGRRGHFDLVLVDAESGEVTEIAAGGTWGEPEWARDGAIVATYEDHGTAPQLRLITPDADPAVLLAPTPRQVRAAPHVRPEEVTYESDGVDVHAFLFRPADASADEPVPPSSTHTAARSPGTATSGTAMRSTSSTRATPGSPRTTEARQATGASSSGCSTGASASPTFATALPQRTTYVRSTGSTATGWPFSERAGARTSPSSRSRTIPSIDSAVPSASTATATC
jgi:Tol biopolymer transport system component